MKSAFSLSYTEPTWCGRAERRFIHWRSLAAGFVLSAVLITTTGHAGVPSLYRPLTHMQQVMGMKVAKHPPAIGWFRQVQHGYRNPPHKRAWLCIHRYEGSWSDPNAPYYGGLQFDLRFQRTYGPQLLATKGTANRWTPLEQMWTAERAHRSGRGFYPWPTTARNCGLI